MATQQTAKTAVQQANDGGGQQPARQGQTMYQMLEQVKPQIERALPKTMTAERFTRIALTTIRQNPSLMRATPASLMGALLTAAQLGLEPGPLGHAYIVPYWNSELGSYEAQFQLGYTGIIDLARRSEHIETITARAVYEADHFDVEYGLNEKLEHKPQLDGDRGQLRFVYAYAKYVGGGHNFVVMSREDIEKVRETSQTGRKNKGPWRDWYEQMSLKSAIKRLRAYLPLSVEMADAFAADEQRLTWSPDDGDVVDIPAEPADPAPPAGGEPEPDAGESPAGDEQGDAGNGESDDGPAAGAGGQSDGEPDPAEPDADAEAARQEQLGEAS
jgi:recombination protein RecT